MRADAEHLKAQIAESLSLLRAHLDWDRALRRLEELNAKAEDPSLWDKPAEAQAVMRERGRLADQVEGVKRLEAEVRDSLELIELAEAEGDSAAADAAVADLARLAEVTEQLASGRISALVSSRSMPELRTWFERSKEPEPPQESALASHAHD